MSNPSSQNQNFVLGLLDITLKVIKVPYPFSLLVTFIESWVAQDQTQECSKY